MSVAATAIASPEAYKNAKLMTIPDVDIDKSGKFKYVLIDRLQDVVRCHSFWRLL